MLSASCSPSPSSILVLIGVIAWFLSRSVDTAFTDGRFDQLESAARISAVGMPVETADLQTWVDTMADAGGYRYTVIDPDGVVLADSHSDPATMDNHADRPEVAAAIAGDTGRDARDSDTTGFDQLYVAVPRQTKGSSSAWRSLSMTLRPRHLPFGVLSSSSRSPLGSSG